VILVTVTAVAGLVLLAGCARYSPAEDDGERAILELAPSEIGLTPGSKSLNVFSVPSGYWTIEIDDPGDGVTFDITDDPTAEVRSLLTVVAPNARIRTEIVSMTVTGCDDMSGCEPDDQRSERADFILDVIDPSPHDGADASASVSVSIRD
jgi:hypothetical protein